MTTVIKSNHTDSISIKGVATDRQARIGIILNYALLVLLAIIFLAPFNVILRNACLTALTVNLPAIFMGATVSILPLVVVFLFMQRYIVEGVKMFGSKG